MIKISFRFTPTKNDYLKAFWTFYSNSPYTWIAFVFFAFLLPIVALSLFIGYELQSGFVMWFPMLIFISTAFFLLFMFVINPLILGNKVEKNERLKSPVEYEVDEEQISIKTPFSESKVDWGTFERMIESEEHILLIYSINKNMFQIIPKRAFLSREDEQSFKDLLILKLPKIKNTPSKFLKTPMSIVILIGIIALFVFFCILVPLIVYGFLLTP